MQWFSVLGDEPDDKTGLWKVEPDIHRDGEPYLAVGLFEIKVTRWLISSKFVRREKDRKDIIGYDDVNQLFWYPEGIARIVLNDRVSMLLR
jgi:hypothetical protein